MLVRAPVKRSPGPRQQPNGALSVAKAFAEGNKAVPAQ
jgi:hypothetical protein